MMGAIIIAVVLFMPNGIAGFIQNFGDRFSRGRGKGKNHV